MGITQSRKLIYRDRRGEREYTSNDSAWGNYGEKAAKSCQWTRSGLPAVREAWLAPLAKTRPSNGRKTIYLTVNFQPISTWWNSQAVMADIVWTGLGQQLETTALRVSGPLSTLFSTLFSPSQHE